MTKVKKYPAAVVFDLDYTVWPRYADWNVQPPLKAVGKNSIKDRSGSVFLVFDDVPAIFKELKSAGIPMIAASKTAAPHIASKMLTLLHIDGVPLIDFFDNIQWGTHTKKLHISRAAKALGLEKELNNGHFVLFDDEYHSNIDVTEIGCYFAHVDDSDYGLSQALFDRELRNWALQL
ncbi:uncharacterized protein KQ657_000448 [Scheffersomyces spartinae]|uniref:Magnesium-dependent phosphatase-1 n=1 Tax=Scheffersomyces spartinae TaxID=45513 RepID=A0A9P7V9L6_9ASCO|nr:uncharacterized protein KQ657_000448 [Scheffersomyces spartinae]KAG7193757.1 hypothetical protein KQ657_000448 [Scheffersomyces spartinae]